jgi:16S rRNA processing protein RimM
LYPRVTNPKSAQAQAQDLLVVGRVTRPHGIVGEVKVELAPEYAGALDGVRRVFIGDTGQPQPCRVLASRSHQGAVLLKLDCSVTRNDAEALRGSRVLIRLTDLPKLPAGAYYSHDLVGLSVVRETGEPLGALVEVLATGSNDVYVIKTASGEVLLPALESVVRAIDLTARQMTVIVPEGLE